ncbi:GL14184 [Drosophila persimilis]|uniref:GL14184 n=1 Tax=Drosophila persimilis TaxID=7234 RepID=B4GTY3_DROPE|nr:GL14184 [Drosophila persimilis]
MAANEQQEDESRPSTSRGTGARESASEKDASMLMVLDVLMELRRGYVSLARLMRSEQERELAHTALLAIDEDIERVHENRFMSPEHRTNQMEVFSESVRRSRTHARLIRNMVHQTRLRYEATMFESQVSGLPDAGGDDGGLARRMSTNGLMGPSRGAPQLDHDVVQLARQEEELQWLRRLSILFLRELNLHVAEDVVWPPEPRHNLHWPPAGQGEQHMLRQEDPQEGGQDENQHR